MAGTPVGTTKGPGDTPHEYAFVAPDPLQRIKYGEFVYYNATVDDEPRAILGRVTRRETLRLLPDSFLADPAVPPETVAALVGYQQPDHDLFQIMVTILGYYDRALGFVNPRVPPRAGASIYIAPDDMLAEVLCLRRPGEIGSAHIGALLSRTGGSVPIVLDARGFTSTHLAIIASTGAGKSYLAGVLLEELMRPYNRAAVLIVDPHAEYSTLGEMANLPAFWAEGYRASVKIVRPGDIKVRISSLEIGDWRYLLPSLSERMHYLLGQTFHRVREKHGDKWTLSQFRIALREQDKEYESGEANQADETEDPSIGGLMWRIGSIFGSREPAGIFDNHVNMPLADLFRPGQCTVLQLNEVPEREQQVVVATLLRRLDQARRDTVRQRAAVGSDMHLPYPVFVLIEEAHNFAPANADIITTQILKQILSEGRKFGVAVGLISQRPGKLDADVLSQCMTQCIMRIINPIDQGRVAESVESVGKDLLAELPALSKGQVIVAGNSVNTPVLVQVRTRLTTHGAENPDAPKAWLAYYDEEDKRQRERDTALPFDAPRQGKSERMYRTGR